ncbi:Glycosyltransferase like family 2 [Salinihabitans flavidus]|uniref:Glycosyltransferase like family 2 n=1 Tax=Salinihabitans flavidus TaxID=569882 RepID=A0A1H8LUE2_9RHOB|nr:glycosyltransferase family 2 protein [Salinihabitans flavidus]SEO08731.1 Glycosyltransferase like family 2 [Salinihabitans flavidus]
MSQCPVSVVVVSRERPAALRLCLKGLSQQMHPAFEIIVVADPGGIAAAEALPFAEHLKLVPYQDANISAARNRGIAAATGEVVAFIDDDAVAEPTWLWHLTAPFAEPRVAAAGGFVRGRNGIAFQWRAQSVDRLAQTRALEVTGDRPVVLFPNAERAIKTEGTNMAARRDILANMGGFDPAFRFFLDETDMNLRLAADGLATAIVPLAEVHHGYLSSERRRADRVPRDLHQMGASFAVFLRKHAPQNEQAGAWARFQAEQRRRLVSHMVAGRLEPGAVRRLLRGLRTGWQDGQARELRSQPPLPRAAEGFRPFPGRPGGRSVLISGRIWRRQALRRKAAELAASGRIVTLMLFSPTALYHRVRFREAGYWEQSGGLFGRSEREQPLFRFWRFGRRVRQERRRVAMQRGLPDE